MYNPAFSKLIADAGAIYSNQITAIMDNVTEILAAPKASGANFIPLGDINEIFQALLNNDAAIKAVADALVARSIKAGEGLTGGGTLQADRTIAHADTSNQENIGSAIPNVVSGMTFDKFGHVTGVSRVDLDTRYYRKEELVPKTGGDFTGSIRLTSGNLNMVDGGAIRVRKQDNSVDYWVLGALEDQLYLGETTIPLAIRSSTNPTIKVGGGAVRAIYHEGNKPTKADVGLGEVQNYPITNSVTDASGVKYASANAVKQAYDRGTEGINNANGRVSKTGDTMTGMLTISHTGNAAVISNSPAGTGNYYVGRINNENHFYIGKGSANSDDTAFYNYKHGVEIRLAADSVRTSAPLNPQIAGPTGLILYRNQSKTANNNIQFSYTDANYFFGMIDGRLKFGTNVDLTSGYSIYHAGSKPTPAEIGAIPNEALGYAYGFHNGQVSFGLGKGNEIGFGIKNGGELYVNYSVGSGYQIPSGLRICNGPSAFGSLRCGEIISSNNVTAYSDIRVKKDLVKIPDALEKIDKINGYTYTRKDTGERQAGVIAQEMLKVLPEVVVDTKDVNDKHIYSVSYGNIVALLIEGIKELNQEVKALKEAKND